MGNVRRAIHRHLCSRAGHVWYRSRMTINLVSGAQRHVYRCALCDSTTHIGSRAPTPRTFDGLRAWTGEHPLKAGALLAAWFVATFVGLGLALRWAALWRVSQW